MPIYDYKCSKCEHQLEIIQKFSDNPIKICPECNEKSLQKLVSAPSFRLKGGGWYETDFKTGAKKNIVDNKEHKSDTPKETKKTTGTSKISKNKPKEES
jgi:putative FmdB family regulatory protein